MKKSKKDLKCYNCILKILDKTIFNHPKMESFVLVYTHVTKIERYQSASYKKKSWVNVDICEISRNSGSVYV